MPTQQAIAEHLGLNQSEVSRHLAALQIDWKTAGMDTIRLAYLAHLRSVAAGHKASDGTDLTNERAMTERVDRELKLLTLAEKRGQLVNLAQLEPELERMVIAFRTEMLSRDDKLKAEIDALYGIDLDLTLVNEHTRAALSQLARYGGERASADRPAGELGGAAGGDVDDGLGQGAAAHVGEGDRVAGALQP